MSFALAMPVAQAGLDFLSLDDETWKEEIAEMLNQISDHEVIVKGPITVHYWPPMLEVQGITFLDGNADEGEVAFEMSAKADMTLSETGLNFGNMHISMEGLEAQVSTNIDLLSEQSFSGRLESLSVQVPELAPGFARLLADLPPLASLSEIAASLAEIKGSADINITETSIGIRALDLQAEDLQGRESQITGSLAMDQQRLDIDLVIDSLHLAETNSPLPEQPPSKQTAPKQAASGELLPLELLTEVHTHSIIRINELNGLLNAVKIEVTNDTKKMNLTASARGFGGKMLLSINSKINSEIAEPVKSTLQFNTEGINLSKLTGQKGLAGSLQVNSALAFTGTTEADLLASISGKSSFNLARGKLDVTPIKRMISIISSISGEPSSISNWPDIMPFERVTGTHLFERGTRAGQVLNVDLENISITGSGGFDLQANTIDFKASTRFNATGKGAFKVSEQLVNVLWPMHCKGDLATRLAELCLGQEDAIARLVEDGERRERREE